MLWTMPPTSQADDELLRPTLSAADDPARMRAAWNPWTLAVLAFLGGPLTAGVLYGENFRRLGQKERFGPTIGIALLACVLAGFGAGRVLALERYAELDETRTLRFACRIAAALLAAVLAGLQARRFRVFTGGGGEEGSLWKFGLAALFLAGTLGNFLALGVLHWTS